MYTSGCLLTELSLRLASRVRYSIMDQSRDHRFVVRGWVCPPARTKMLLSITTTVLLCRLGIWSGMVGANEARLGFTYSRSNEITALCVIKQPPPSPPPPPKPPNNDLPARSQSPTFPKALCSERTIMHVPGTQHSSAHTQPRPQRKTHVPHFHPSILPPLPPPSRPQNNKASHYTPSSTPPHKTKTQHTPADPSNHPSSPPSSFFSSTPCCSPPLPPFHPQGPRPLLLRLLLRAKPPSPPPQQQRQPPQRLPRRVLPPLLWPPPPLLVQATPATLVAKSKTEGARDGKKKTLSSTWYTNIIVKARWSHRLKPLGPGDAAYIHLLNIHVLSSMHCIYEKKKMICVCLQSSAKKSWTGRVQQSEEKVVL